MAVPEISSTNGALTFISFCSFGFNITSFSGKMGTDLFKNVKQQSLEFITPVVVQIKMLLFGHDNNPNDPMLLLIDNSDSPSTVKQL